MRTGVALGQNLISIHAPREGGDRTVYHARPTWSNFNPRPPRGGRLGDMDDASIYPDISIHAPREGGDSASV